MVRDDVTVKSSDPCRPGWVGFGIRSDLRIKWKVSLARSQ